MLSTLLIISIRREKGCSSKEYKIAKAESKKPIKKDKIFEMDKEADVICTLPPYKQYSAVLKRLKAKLNNIS